MGDEEDGTVDLIEKACKVGRVGAHAAERIGRSDDVIAELLQTFDHSVPTGRVGEGTVYDDDSWLSVGVHYAYLLSCGSAGRTWFKQVLMRRSRSMLIVPPRRRCSSRSSSSFSLFFEDVSPEM